MWGRGFWGLQKASAANLCNIYFTHFSWNWKTSKRHLRARELDSQQTGSARGRGGFFFWYISLPYITRWCCCTLLDDAAILNFRVGFGFRGGCWLWGPVGVHAEFLGQMHVSRLGCYVARAAQPGKTLGRVPVDALLEKEKGKKKKIPQYQEQSN